MKNKVKVNLDIIGNEDLLRQIKERMDKSHNIKGFSLD